MIKAGGLSGFSLFVVDNPHFGLASARRLSLHDPIDITLHPDAFTVLTRDELLAVIGHELGHIVLGHVDRDSFTTPEKELEADRIGAHISRRRLALATALQKIERYNKKREAEYLDFTLPRILARRGSLRRSATEALLRAVFRAADRISGIGYPETTSRINQLRQLEATMHLPRSNCDHAPEPVDLNSNEQATSSAERTSSYVKRTTPRGDRNPESHPDKPSDTRSPDKRSR